MKTSYFAKSGYDPNGVSIAYSSPIWYTGRRYTLLAPPHNLLQLYKNGKIDKDDYEEIYSRRVLWHLRPKHIIVDLGEDAVLLCYEKPPKFCHRHIVAKWLMDNTGVVIEEV